jgi:hypothetical protein
MHYEKLFDRMTGYIEYKNDLVNSVIMSKKSSKDFAG